ncbi:integrase catalytic domain-containing protein [Trichonephila clavipes]|nr:integrase catalytic domain-containing protein [Trichonephila clavipes]
MPYTPQQNGAAERENRIIVECARSNIYAANLPLKLWAEAENTSVYVLNRTWPTSVKDKSPCELCRDVIFQNEKSCYVPDISSTDIQNSDFEIVKKPLQKPDPDVVKEIEEIPCSAEDREEILAEQQKFVRQVHIKEASQI